MTTTFAMAVTSEGEVYGWGKNDNNILGLDVKLTDKQIGTPTKIELFSKYKVKSVSLGKQHSLIYTKKLLKNKESEGSVLFALGQPDNKEFSYFGVSKETISNSKTKFGPFEISNFEDC